MDAVTEPVLLDAAQISALLGIDKSFFYTLKATGRLPPAIRLSRRAVRWRKNQVMAWIDAGCPTWEKMKNN
jgi:predicted DNA-binding transcriptional regulator AlpA